MPGGGSDERRVDDNVVVVAARAAVEGAPAGHEAQLGAGGRAVDGLRGEPVLRVERHGDDREANRAPVRTGDVDQVTRPEGPEPEEHAGAVAGVDVPADDRGPLVAGDDPRAV